MFIGHLHHLLSGPFPGFKNFILSLSFLVLPFKLYSPFCCSSLFSQQLGLCPLVPVRAGCWQQADWLFSIPDPYVYLTLLSLPSSTWKHSSPPLLEKKFELPVKLQGRINKIIPYWVPASIITLHQKTYSWTHYLGYMDVIFLNFWKKVSNGILLPRHHHKHHSLSSWPVFC